jgi:hypothetical protein
VSGAADDDPDDALSGTESSATLPIAGSRTGHNQYCLVAAEGSKRNRTRRAEKYCTVQYLIDRAEKQASAMP